MTPSAAPARLVGPADSSGAEPAFDRHRRRLGRPAVLRRLRARQPGALRLRRRCAPGQPQQQRDQWPALREDGGGTARGHRPGGAGDPRGRRARRGAWPGRAAARMRPCCSPPAMPRPATRATPGSRNWPRPRRAGRHAAGRARTAWASPTWRRRAADLRAAARRVPREQRPGVGVVAQSGAMAANLRDAFARPRRCRSPRSSPPATRSRSASKTCSRTTSPTRRRVSSPPMSSRSAARGCSCGWRRRRARPASRSCC